MWFLIRAAFWFSLVLLALPFGVGSGTSDDTNVGPVQAFVAAREAVGDIAGICERKPDVCATGKEAMHTIAVRAKATVKMAAEMMDDTEEKPDEATVTGSVPKADVGASAKSSQKAPAKN
jgi:hypothetical protein